MTTSRRRDDTIRAVDLFCGAGGLSWGLANACEALETDVDLVAVNHWNTAIETHQENHPWATHYNAKVEELRPRDVFETERVDILTGGPKCTHYANARGSRPVDEQKRASPWHILDWLQELYVDNFVIENVPEFRSWGPVGVDGQPLESNKGETFDAWIDALHSLGYSVDWRVLNAADYGDATSRDRLFIVGRRNHRPSFPEPSHSDTDVEKPDRRPASDIIDWSDAGSSVWTRSRPLVENTMKRIADGIRRHCEGERLDAFADVIGDLTKADVEQLQNHVVELEEMPEAAEERVEPFLLRQQSGGRPPSVDEPVPTIATKGAISKVETTTFVLPRNGFHRGLHSNPAYDPDERPLHTVTAKNTDGHVVTPYLVKYYGNSTTASVDDPLDTVTTKGRFALCVPELGAYGLDIRFRMLKPEELAAAMGFPSGYEFVGNKTETIEQIGNAVPVNLGTALCKQALASREPTLLNYDDNDDSPSRGAPRAVTDGGEE